MYRIQKLNFSIHGNSILKDINFEIKPNNFLAIIGRNGSGKSTLLKIINKNITGYTGNIFLDEKNVQDYSFKQLSLRRAMLNQSLSFSYNFLVKDFLQMGMDVHPISLARKKEIENFLVEKLSLQKILFKNYQILSGGQKQRVQLGRVLAQIFITDSSEDKFLFLDEPTLNLDIYQQYKILELLEDLIHEKKIGICAVLHDLHQTYQYADEVLILEKGKIYFLGKTSQALKSKNILQVFGVQSDFLYSQKLKQKALLTGIK